MPEGDTIHYAANRIRPILEGHVPDVIRTPAPRLSGARLPERLAGRAIASVDAYGKHLFLRFEGELTLHSHLRMTGAWGAYERGRRWRRHPRRAWLVISRGEHDIVEFDGPVLELMTESRTRLDERIAGLGPDILGRELDEQRILLRLRSGDPGGSIGDALLDQRTVAGIGNLWKCEACWEARIDPWRSTRDVTDAEVLQLLRAVRPRMQQSARHGMRARQSRVYGRAGQPCARCRTTIRVRGQGDGNRPTSWCPECQT